MTKEAVVSDGNTIQLTAANIADVISTLPKKVGFVVRALVMLQQGSVKVTIPEGKTIEYNAPQPGPHAEATFHNWGVVRRILSHGSLGVAESYIEGEWDSPDVTSFLQMFLINSYGGGAESFFNRNPLLNLLSKFGHYLNRNSKTGAKRNIAAHYDLGNEFYTQWLDPSMTYSSAIFRDGANSLEEAQEAKYRSLAKLTDIQPDHHVLEIGCGWGGFAEFVASNIGAKVTCLTISQEQLNFARERIKKAGLDHLVDIKFLDYRDETGKYDRIGSIEMFEAVGESYWPSYFGQLHNCLKPGGRAGLQVITIREEDYETYRAQPDFIQKYIFPGGMLPSAEILSQLGSNHQLAEVASRAFGTDYAATLEAWRLKFWEKWPTIKPLGFDERFKRIWEFYFHYCEAGFKAESINVRQLIYQKT
ncbi:MAG: methyltransferase domain-containing protein [Rhizobiaceae bacterium]|nr:methyltransferase domain-containing protein [Rhizobiaceae bacterium]